MLAEVEVCTIELRDGGLHRCVAWCVVGVFLADVAAQWSADLSALQLCAQVCTQDVPLSVVCARPCVMIRGAQVHVTSNRALLVCHACSAPYEHPTATVLCCTHHTMMTACMAHACITSCRHGQGREWCLKCLIGPEECTNFALACKAFCPTACMKHADVLQGSSCSMCLMGMHPGGGCTVPWSRRRASWHVPVRTQSSCPTQAALRQPASKCSPRGRMLWCCSNCLLRLSQQPPLC